MSELAFNLAGEPFEVPGSAVGWRVRRMKPKGAPEVVYGRDGIPLTLPIDADIEDLRREARAEGRYRLDPIDDANRSMAGAPAGYVYLHALEPAARGAAVAPVASPTEQALIEAMRVNAELARSVVDRFPQMLESAAILLRAADVAGVPVRLARAVAATAAEAGKDAEPEADEEEDDDEDEEGDDDQDDEDEPADVPKPSALQTLIDTLTPAIINAVVSGKIQIPGGLAALLDCRRASPKASAEMAARAQAAHAQAAHAHAAHGQAARAPAAHAQAAHAQTAHAQAAYAQAAHAQAAHAQATHAQAAQAQAAHAQTAHAPAAHAQAGRAEAAYAPHSTAEAAATPADRPGRTAAESAASSAGPTASAAPTSASVPSRPAAHGSLPVLGPTTMAHLAAIYGALSPEESALARSIAAELPPAELATWIAELESMSVADATAKIRALLAALAPRASRPVAPGHGAHAAATSTSDPRGDVMQIDPTVAAHFQAVQAELSPRERVLARAIAAELSPEDRRTWLASLAAVPVADAAATVRALIGGDAPAATQPHNPTQGGAP